MSATVVTAARLVQPAADPLADPAVVVEGDVIGWVGRRAELPAGFADVKPIDLGDATLVPGLIDAHVHLSLPTDAEVRGVRADVDAAQLAVMYRSARELAEAGVTTARDLGGLGYLTLRVRDAIASGDAVGPRLLVAGSPLTPPGGHCWFLGGEVADADQARDLVRAHVAAGVDVIKVMATGGFLTPGTTPWDASFDAATLRVVVEEAHRLGRRVAGHCHGVEGIRLAFAAGVDTLEHCSFAGEGGGSDFDDELADALAEARAYVSPTMNADARDLMARGWDPPVVELWRRGARVIASTDAGIPGTPHGEYALALAALVDAGMPDDAVFAAATLNAAEALDLAGIAGRIAPGYSADLLAVRGDPSRDIRVLGGPRFVMARGRVVRG